MYYNATRKVIPLSGDREIIIETGKLAKQADGSVVVKQGNTMLLATVTAAKEPKDDCDFMPLSVEYKEKYASCGRFPGGFLKREARPSDYEILVSRLIDRALRPLFPSDFHAEVFVTVNLISADKDIMPDALAGLAASAALAGGLLGYLIWNFYPAKVFMGDTGSLFMGGMVVGLAFQVGLPLLLVLTGVIYWCEALSVILQVISFKTTGKRIFKMSPIHHHFELSGWSEVRIVGTFAAVGLIGGALGVWSVLLL